MAQEQLAGVEKDREILIRCIEEAHESLRLMAGVDENGPALVWLADQLLQAYRRSGKGA